MTEKSIELLEKVKSHFKNAKSVICLLSSAHRKFNIDHHTIRFIGNSEDGNYIICDDLDHMTSYVVLYCKEPKNFAQIVEEKESKFIDNSDSSINNTFLDMQLLLSKFK